MRLSLSYLKTRLDAAPETMKTPQMSGKRKHVGERDIERERDGMVCISEYRCVCGTFRHTKGGREEVHMCLCGCERDSGITHMGEQILL